jgi:hypothetical protein
MTLFFWSGVDGPMHRFHSNHCRCLVKQWLCQRVLRHSFNSISRIRITSTPVFSNV